MMVRKSISAFSLIEVTLAIGIISFALVSTIGLIPVGLNAGRGAIDSTQTSLIARDVFNRVGGLFASGTQFSNPGSQSVGPWFYDDNGTYLGDLQATSTGLASGGAKPLFSVRVNVAPLADYSSLPSVDDGALKGVSVVLGWPVDTNNLSNVQAARSTYTFFIRKP